jgi:hypothetical protein
MPRHAEKTKRRSRDGRCSLREGKRLESGKIDENPKELEELSGSERTFEVYVKEWARETERKYCKGHSNEFLKTKER